MKAKKHTRRNSKFDDQIRFNWGYHDANTEASHGKRRQLLRAGPQNLMTVSLEYDPAYFFGYAAGLAAADMSAHHGDSESAWNYHRSQSYA